MDLFGEQPVQVLTALLQAACLLLAAMLVVLSVRSAGTGPVPARAITPMQICLNPMDIDRPTDQALRCNLPARAPPDPSDCHDRLTGILSPQ